MQIQLNQSDIETAVRNYVSAMGITRQIDEIQFTVSRKGGQSVEAEIDLADCTGGGRVRETTPEPVAEEPAKAKPEEPVKTESDATEAAPFRTEDASNDATGEEAGEPESDTAEAPETEGKSLFS